MLKYCRLYLLLLSCVAAIGFPAIPAADVPSDAQLRRLGLEAHWQGQAVLDVSRDEVRSVTADEDVIVVQSTAGVVSVFNAEDGRRRWAAQVGRNDEPGLPAVTYDRLVLIVAGPVLYGLDKFTGDEVIQHRLQHPASTSPGVGSIEREDLRYDFVYVPLTEGSVYAYDLKTLQHLERYGSLPPQVSRSFEWRFICREAISFPPVTAEETVVFVTDVGNLHILNALGQSQYQFLLEEPGTTPLSVVRDPETSSVLMATGNNLLYNFTVDRPSVAKATAQTDWTYPINRPMTGRPLIVGNNVFVASQDGGLHNLARDTGRLVRLSGDDGRSGDWYVDEIAGVAAVTETRVFAIDQTNRLVAIDRATADPGDVDSRISVAGYEHRYQNAATDRIYLVSSSGEVLCLREQGSEFATYHQNPGKQPIEVDASAPDVAAEAQPPAE